MLSQPSKVIFLFLKSKIPKAMCQASGNVIHFTIMDHDIFMSNDFEGEACLELNQLPGIKAELTMPDINSPTVFELFLTNPKGKKTNTSSK